MTFSPNLRTSYANIVVGAQTNNTMTNQSTRVGSTDPFSSNPVEPPLETHVFHSIDNNTHHLYFHNNDQPGMILISKKLIGS